MSRDFTELGSFDALPLLGHLEAIRDPLDFMQRLAAAHGDLSRFRVGGQHVLVVLHPDAIEQVLVKLRHATVKDPVTASLREVAGQGLFTAEGETWQRSRRLVAPSFRPQHLAELAEIMLTAAEEAVATIEPGSRDVQRDMNALALDVALRTLFGMQLQAEVEHVGPLVEALMRDFDHRKQAVRRRLPAWLPNPIGQRVKRRRTELHGLLQTILEQKRASGTGDGTGTVLDRLLAARDDDGHPMDDEQLRDEMLTFFVAGHETSSLALSYSLWLLATHPRVRSCVREELDRVTNGELRAEHVRELPYLDAVVRESLRLYPPVWVVGRQATEELVVGDVRVPAGTMILLPQWLVQRDPRWWDEPEAFRPERWLDGSERPRFAWFPFGGGQRICVGQHFATTEIILVLATWLRHFDMHPDPGFELELDAQLTLRPQGGVHLVLEPLRPSVPPSA